MSGDTHVRYCNVRIWNTLPVLTRSTKVFLVFFVFGAGLEIIYLCKGQIVNKSEKSTSQKKHGIAME